MSILYGSIPLLMVLNSIQYEIYTEKPFNSLKIKRYCKDNIANNKKEIITTRLYNYNKHNIK